MNNIANFLFIFLITLYSVCTPCCMLQVIENGYIWS